jgi:DNA-binding NarL/FixJ family response regulator
MEVRTPAHELSSPPPTRVLIVDDDDFCRTGLRALLDEAGFEVADSASGPAAVRRVPSFAPHVVVMDIDMPGMSGVEATPLVLEAAPQTSVLMLTIATHEAGVLDAIRAGASGYLLKDAELNVITAGIRAAAAGHCPIAPRVASALVAAVRCLESGRPERAAASAGPKLSPREQQVLSVPTIPTSAMTLPVAAMPPSSPSSAAPPRGRQPAGGGRRLGVRYSRLLLGSRLNPAVAVAATRQRLPRRPARSPYAAADPSRPGFRGRGKRGSACSSFAWRSPPTASR